MKPLPKPESWRSTNPAYEHLPPRTSRIRLDPCDPDSRMVEVVEIDGGCAYDAVQHNNACNKKPK